MAGALKLAAAVAALAAVGWVVTGGTGPRQGALQVEGPSPSPTSLVGEDWAFFSGRWDHSGSSDSWFTSEYEDNGVKVSLGYSAHGDVVVTDDPRMLGTRTRTLNLFSFTALQPSTRAGAPCAARSIRVEVRTQAR